MFSRFGSGSNVPSFSCQDIEACFRIALCAQFKYYFLSIASIQSMMKNIREAHSILLQSSVSIFNSLNV